MTPPPDDTPAIPHADPDTSPLRPIVFSGHPGACFLDAFVLVFVALGTGLMMGLVVEVFPALRGREDALLGSLLFLCLLCTAGDIAFAASPGKAMLGVVIRAASGAPAPLWRLTVRWAVKYSAALLFLVKVGAFQVSPPLSVIDIDSWLDGPIAFCFWGVVAGTLLALLPSRRTLHDFLAGTAVFDAACIARDVDPPQRGFEVSPLPAAVLPLNPDETSPPAPSPAASDHLP